MNNMMFKELITLSLRSTQVLGLMSTSNAPLTVNILAQDGLLQGSQQIGNGGVRC